MGFSLAGRGNESKSKRSKVIEYRGEQWKWDRSASGGKVPGKKKEKRWRRTGGKGNLRGDSRKVHYERNRRRFTEKPFRAFDKGDGKSKGIKL